jgi:hypothetical protein
VTASAVVHALSAVPAARRGRQRGWRSGTPRGAGDGAPRRRRIEVEARSRDVLTVSLTVVPDGRARRVTNVVLEGAARRVFDGTVDWPLRREP